MTEWLRLCFSKNVMRRSFWTAIIVGAILVMINHGEAILHGQVTTGRIFQIILTVCVPYIVSTVSSVSTMLSLRK